MDPKATQYINGGMEFWVRFNDGTKAQFAICSECFPQLTTEQLKNIMASQKVSWGMEIEATVRWYATKAIHLEIVAHAKEENGLPT